MKSGEYGSRPILLKLIFPVTLLIIIVVLLVSGAIFGGGITGWLNQNASDILYEKVLNRKSYIENEMISRWSHVTLTVEQVNLAAQEMLDAGQIDLNTLDANSASCAPLLSKITGGLISMLRSNGVNGVFVVFNTEDLSESVANESIQNKPGLYIRDLDAASVPSSRNADLLLLCSPAAIVQELGISTDNAWNTYFNFSEHGYYPFLYEPFMAAYNADQQERIDTYSDYGYWSAAYRLPGDSRSAFSYTVPLILDDGTVYGVLGIEILEDALNKMLPYGEIAEGKLGTYVLAIDYTDDLAFAPVVVNGYLNAPGRPAEHIQATPSEQRDTPEYVIQSGSEILYCAVEYLKLYNANTPFAQQRWAVMGVVRSQELFSVSNRVIRILLTALLLALIIGLIGSAVVSWFVARPVSALSREMSGVNANCAIELNRTHIAEIDQLIASVEVLSRDVIDSANKFSKIIEMASIKIAGFEICEADGSLFITHNFFELLGHGEVDLTTLTPASVRAFLDNLWPYVMNRAYDDGRLIYKLPNGGAHVYISLSLSYEGEHIFGLIEDVTKELLEVEKIEYERDHDVLTSLMNRRAFERNMRRLFEQEPGLLKTAALVMIDLDNLKSYNDTYGHEGGDIYIRSAADCFARNTPEKTLVSRIAGDEFCLFFYGYETKEAIRREIARLRDGIEDSTILLSDSDVYPLEVSAGVAWYPEDAKSHDVLFKYADFAMYTVKRSAKNEFANFDEEEYRKSLLLQQSKSELADLIEQELMTYQFQPIVTAGTGKVIGYEALMKPNTPTLSTADEVLAIAELDEKLDQIEALTFRNAMTAFAAHVEGGAISRDCKVFIKSISNQILNTETLTELETRFADYLSNIVIEVTEDEELSDSLAEIKARTIRKWKGEIALDDYGSAYNSEMALLRLNPDYIKVDMALVRDIDADAGKQKLMRNTISYAHERGLLVIAEGVETEEEFAAALEMQVDCVQGYYIAPPTEPPLSRETLEELVRSKRRAREQVG